MSHRSNRRAAKGWARDEARLRDARESPGPITRRYACPRCGGAHSAAECEAGVAHLEWAELLTLRARVHEELAAAMLNDAEQPHVQAVLAVLRGVEARIAREAERPLPTLKRRQTIAAEKEPTYHAVRNRHSGKRLPA